MCIKCPPYILKRNHIPNEKLCELCGKFSASNQFKKCDHKNCTIFYHKSCITRVKIMKYGAYGFMKLWECPCHSCFVCQSKENLIQCYRCQSTFCQRHRKGQIFNAPNNNNACELHYATFCAKEWHHKKMTLRNLSALQIAIQFWKHEIDAALIADVKAHRLNTLAVKVLQVEIEFLRDNLFMPMSQKSRIFVDIHEIGNVIWEYFSLRKGLNSRMRNNWYVQVIIRELIKEKGAIYDSMTFLNPMHVDNSDPIQL